MPVTSVTKDPEALTLTLVADFPVPQERLWAAWADPRQLERFWGPPSAPATFTHHDFRVGGRAEYFLTGPDGEKWSGAWKFTAVDPIASFVADDGEDNAEDEAMPMSMTFAFEATPTGSRMISVTRFSSVEAMEQTTPGMEEGLRAAMPQLDEVLAG
ncbi:SRPBCC domain-containing protein [Amycolatopsis sp. NPDC051371]|uniref:SRPBCC family protein n=1 Tax=Amycolatopsis sp. NPDC051371 TaxID=3155800 RepID=UPI0034435BD5